MSRPSDVARMPLADFERLCQTQCERCAAGDPLRQREDTHEYVHDWAFGLVDPRLGRRPGMGHSICQAHALRLERSDRLA